MYVLNKNYFCVIMCEFFLMFAFLPLFLTHKFYGLQNPCSVREFLEDTF